jgi:hypothetical protein
MRNTMRNISPLNALACERLKHGSLGDPTHPGLRIMVRPKSGRKVWVYRYRDPSGRMAQLLIGTYPALSLADARTEWRNAKAVRDKHGDPRDTAKLKRAAAAAHAERSRGYTVAQAARDYRMDHMDNLARGH